MIYYIICSVGLCWILKYGKILNLIRNFLISRSNFFSDLFKCALCLGFWSGVILAPMVYYDYGILKSIIYPLASSAICWVCDIGVDFVSGLNLIYVEQYLDSSDQKKNSHDQIN